MGIQPASGSKDLNPQEVEENKHVANCLSEVYKLWGYKEISPPTIERLQTLMAGGAISTKDIALLVSDEEFGLRPEMTASISRAANTRMENYSRPLRVWATGTVFNCKEESDGKIRIEESLESDVEIFGDNKMQIEIELLYLLIESLNNLRISRSTKPVILIGNTSLLDLILSNFKPNIRKDIRVALTEYNLISLDHLDLDKKDINLLSNIIKLRGMPSEVIEKLINKLGNHELLVKLKDLFTTIEPVCLNNGIEIQLDPTFRPKFELYSGTIFNLVCKPNNIPIVIAKGGRYDGLANIFNKSLNNHSGAGFSFSIDKVRELNKTSPNSREKEIQRVLVAYGPSKKIENALEKQSLWHKKGVIALIELQQCKDKNTAQELLITRGCNTLDWINT